MTWDEAEPLIKAGKIGYRKSDPKKFRWLLRWGQPGPDFWWQNPTTGSQHGFAITQHDKAEQWEILS